MHIYPQLIRVKLCVTEKKFLVVQVFVEEYMQTLRSSLDTILLC